MFYKKEIINGRLKCQQQNWYALWCLRNKFLQNSFRRTKTIVSSRRATKEKFEKLHVAQFSIRTMNSVDRNYSLCQSETLTRNFTPRGFIIYLISHTPFQLINDHQSMQGRFGKEYLEFLSQKCSFLERPRFWRTRKARSFKQQRKAIQNMQAIKQLKESLGIAGIYLSW